MKLLKLVGIETYVSPITNFTAVRKGQVIGVDDSKAAYLMEGFEVDRADNHNSHWQEMPAGSKADHMFSGEYKAPEVQKSGPTIWHAPVAKDIDMAQLDKEVAQILEEQPAAEEVVQPTVTVVPRKVAEAAKPVELPAETPASAPVADAVAAVVADTTVPEVKKTQRIQRKKG